MSINFEVLMDTGEYAVDMKSGVKTLEGISDTTTCITEAVLSNNVPKKITSQSSVRTNLKKTFEGSYGQNFSLQITDDGMREEYRRIGSAAFAEIMSYFMYESLYLEPPLLSEAAETVIENMGNVAEKLKKQLRVSSMKKAHALSITQGYDLKLRVREGTTRTLIAQFNSETANGLLARMDREPIVVRASITRLNINTGNGRLALEDQDDTVAFGFGALYRDVGIRLKKVLSKNLDFNNARPSDEWQVLAIRARPIKLRDGRVIKYIIQGFLE